MGIERAISFINVKTIKTKCQQFVSGEYRFPSVYGFKVLETLSLIPSINYTFVNLKKYFAFSSYHQDCRRASSEGWEPDLLRPRLHHQAQVHGGEHRGGAARVHHLEEGEQDAQLWHWEGRHQVDCHLNHFHIFVPACEPTFLPAAPRVASTLPGQHSPTLATTLAWWAGLPRLR